MSYKNISFHFAIILFISLLNLIYSFSWYRLETYPIPGFGHDDRDASVCAGNKIGIKYKKTVSYAGATHQFSYKNCNHNQIYSFCLYSSKGGKLVKQYYNSNLIRDYEFCCIIRLCRISSCK